MNQDHAAAHITVRGRVQGVGFRFFAEGRARALGLTGWVRNLPNGDVESEAYGPRAVIEQFVAELRKGPAMSRVQDVQVTWCLGDNSPNDFEIR